MIYRLNKAPFFWDVALTYMLRSFKKLIILLYFSEFATFWQIHFFKGMISLLGFVGKIIQNIKLCGPYYKREKKMGGRQFLYKKEMSQNHWDI